MTYGECSNTIEDQELANVIISRDTDAAKRGFHSNDFLENCKRYTKPDDEVTRLIVPTCDLIADHRLFELF